MRNYTEIISWSLRRRHLTVAEPRIRSGSSPYFPNHARCWSTGPALCSPYTHGATVDNAADRVHEIDFKATPLCKTCARFADDRWTPVGVEELTS